jgi:hypothetical protein
MWLDHALTRVNEAEAENETRHERTAYLARVRDTDARISRDVAASYRGPPPPGIR